MGDLTSKLFEKYRGTYAGSSEGGACAPYDAGKMKKTRLHEVRTIDQVGSIAISKRGENFADRIVCWLEDLGGRLGARTASKKAGDNFLKDIALSLGELGVDRPKENQIYKKIQSHVQKGKSLRAQVVRDTLKDVAELAKRKSINIPSYAEHAFPVENQHAAQNLVREPNENENSALKDAQNPVQEPNENENSALKDKVLSTDEISAAMLWVDDKINPDNHPAEARFQKRACQGVPIAISFARNRIDHELKGFIKPMSMTPDMAFTSQQREVLKNSPLQRMKAKLEEVIYLHNKYCEDQDSLSEEEKAKINTDGSWNTEDVLNRIVIPEVTEDFIQEMISGLRRFYISS